MDFVRAHPPFDRLTATEMAKVEGALEAVYFAKGTPILRRSGAPSGHLHMIRKGSVVLSREGQPLQVLETGELFGYPSMLGRSAPTSDVVAEEDTLVYRVPETVFRALMENPAFSEFFLLGLAGRLRRTLSAEPASLNGNLSPEVGTLVARAPVFIDQGATVGEAARMMSEARVSSVLVRGDPPGILTDRDFRGRVLAQGLGPATPVSDVMSRPLRTLHAGASLFEALLFMLTHRIHHLPLEKEGLIVGVVTDTDLLRQQIKTPLYLLSRVEKMEDRSVLADYGGELAGMVEALFSGSLDVAQIGRVVSSLNDALVSALLRQAEAGLGPPPTPYAWIVFGSEGRMEQALLTDQDNALVFAEDSPGARTYFAELAGQVVNGLIEAGFPPCRGGFMATAWCHPLAEWERLFRGWTESPTPQHLVEAANFFDYRAVHGGLDLGSIERIVLGSSERSVFLAQLARVTIEFRPPIGFFHRIQASEGGVDLKAGGIIPIVSLARLHALEARVSVRPTIERLDAAVGAGVLSREGAETLGEAFRFILRLRLRGQLAKIRVRQTPGNRASLEDLSPLERRHLKESFVAIHEAQEAAALRYQTSRLG